jgi:U3 small nucleolar RNA-associated protein 14
MTKYQERVKINREADILDFTNTKKHNITAKAIASASADNNLEKQIKDLLVKNKYDTDDKIIEQENEKLLAVDPEELKHRYEELKKVKMLLFQQEMVHKRKSKIKSKLYHKIKNKQKNRQESEILMQLEQVDPEGVKRYLESKKLDRAKERMQLRHSMNSKFSKTVKRYKLQGDDNVKEAIKENFKLRDELLKKIKGLEDDDQDDDVADEGNELNEEDEYAEEDSNEDNEDDEEEEVDENKLLINFDESKGNDKPEEKKTSSGVFGMKFMQNNSGTIQSKLKDVLNDVGGDSEDDEENSFRKEKEEDDMEDFEKEEPVVKGKQNARRKNVLEMIPKKKPNNNENTKLTSNVFIY